MANNISWVVRLMALDDEFEDDGVLYLDLHFNTRAAARLHKRGLYEPDVRGRRILLLKAVTDDNEQVTYTPAR